MEANLKILDNKYYLNEKLSSDYNSDIYLANTKFSSTPVAIKILKEQHQADFTQYTQEIALLSKLSHKNIIKVLDSGQGSIINKGRCSDKKYYLVIEHAAKQELFNYVFYPKKPFDESKARFIFHEIIEALQACHLAGIVHRDLRIENIYLDQDWNIKLTAFGCGAFIDESLTQSLPNVGNKKEAPEVRRKKQYDPIKADIFSLGVILFTLVVGYPPFNETSNRDVFFRLIVKHDIEGFWKKAIKGQMLTKEVMELIMSLLNIDPVNRPSIETIKAHPWLSLPYANEYDLRSDFEQREDVIIDKKVYELKEDDDDDAKSSSISLKVFRSGDCIHSNSYFKPGCECKKSRKKQSIGIVNFKGSNPIRFMNDLAKTYDVPEESYVEIDEKTLEFSVTFEQACFEENTSDECQAIVKMIVKMYQCSDGDGNEYQLVIKRKTGDYAEYMRKCIEMRMVIKRKMKLK